MRLPTAVLTVFLAVQAALSAQARPHAILFQEAQSLPVTRGAGITVIPLPRSEKGKPYSATATTEVSRTLLDGTHVSQTTTTLEYRDEEGRVRIENWGRVSPTGPPRTITIRDPVARVIYKLDSVHKTAEKLSSDYSPEHPAAETAGTGGRGGALHANEESNVVAEDLGVALFSGASAHGTRVTTVVPVGAIGNDREFRSTSERWFSSELNLLVKSVSTDPRFGTTTFTRTNIRRSVPDVSLFQVPPDYKFVAESNH